MSFFNATAVGFVVVSAGTFVGVDYFNAAKTNGYGFGEYAFTDYLEGHGIEARAMA